MTLSGNKIKLYRIAPNDVSGFIHYEANFLKVGANCKTKKGNYVCATFPNTVRPGLRQRETSTSTPCVPIFLTIICSKRLTKHCPFLPVISNYKSYVFPSHGALSLIKDFFVAGFVCFLLNFLFNRLSVEIRIK